MDPIFKFPASPGTPLFPVSPERANRQQLPQSPSLPSIANLHNDPFIAHSRGNSDVQGKVAQFNNLSKEAAQRRKDNEAALKRAVLGREEAESETRRLKEENKVLRKDIEEGRARERKVGERVEGVMEELQQSKETLAHSQAIYEKEVRRARKEAFKSSSALVKLQEELKTARNRYTLMREEVDVQRRKVDAKEEEVFAAQYQLVGLEEELDKLRQKKMVVEAERDALKTSLKEEEVARIAAEGAIALPKSREGDELDSPKKRSRAERRESLKENVDPEAPEVEDELVILQDELRMEKRTRQRAEDQVHFLKMECQFQCCSCRVAERQGLGYVHDKSLEDGMAKIAAKTDTRGKGKEKGTNVQEEVKKPATLPIPESIQNQATIPSVPKPIQDRPTTPSPSQPSPDGQITKQLLTFSPTTGTFYKAPSPTKEASPSEQFSPVKCTSPTKRSSSQQPQSDAEDFTLVSPSTPQASRQASPTKHHPSSNAEDLTLILPPTTLPTHSTQISAATKPYPSSPPSTTQQPTPPPLTFPSTPRPLPIPPPRTISHTTTTTVPLKDDIFSPAPATPGGINREEALEQIRQRRGRARSVAMGNGTPRKAVGDLGMGGWTPRREISAPAGRM